MKLAAVVSSLVVACAWAVEAGDSRLNALLAAVARYVESYEPQLSTMIAEEEYVQSARRGGGREEQRTTSEFLFLKLPGVVHWAGFRDVYSVDGQPLRTEKNRLGRIVQNGADIAEEAAELAAENARFNLGPVVRTINVPTLVLGWLAAEAQGRFDFELKGEKTISGTRCRVVSFRERETPTLVRGMGDTNLKSSGRFCATADGRVWWTELRPEGSASVIVTYRVDPQFGILVPGEMRETYGRDRVEGVARYSNYRRFSVTARIK